MRLTQFSDYALRVLIYLALKRRKLVTIREISESYGISRNHLMKVVNMLTREGFLLAQRGPGGGLKLAHPVTSINLGDVIKATEEDFALVECFRSDNQCVITPACRAKDVFREAAEAFTAVLGQYSLADLVDKEDELKVLLKIA